MREDDLRADSVQQPNHFFEHRLSVDHAQVAFFQAVVGAADCGRGGPPFSTANPGDLVGPMLSRAAIPGRHGREVDGPAVLRAESQQRAGAEELGIIRMGQNGDRDAVHGRTSGSGVLGPRSRFANRITATPIAGSVA